MNDSSVSSLDRRARLLLTDPQAFAARLRLRMGWMLGTLLHRPSIRSINGVRFEFDATLSPYVKAMYFDWYDELVVQVMRQVLHQGDTFLDVGANIGYISAIGASLVGPRGEVHSFEPVPQYFDRLARFASQNPRYTIRANRTALGETDGSIQMAISPTNIGANSVRLGPSNGAPTIDVPLTRLDSYIAKHIHHPIALIKIDVENFEFPVLRGLAGYLTQPSHRPPIICEIWPKDHPPETLRAFAAYMAQYNYRAYAPSGDRVIALEDRERLPDVIFAVKPPGLN